MVCAVFWAMPALGEEPACKGWIGVDSGEEAGATIMIDGKKYPSLTPATIKGVPCGKHTVEIKKPLFKGGKKTIDVKAGDVIIKFGDIDVADIQDLAAGLRKFKAGQKVDIIVRRDDAERTSNITLGEPHSVP